MMSITINIPEEMMQRVESQNQSLQSLLLEALNECLEKKDMTKSKTWELCETFEIAKNVSKGQKMAEALNQIAMSHSLDEINPQDWQREIRGDR